MPGVLDVKTGKVSGRFVYPPTPGLDFSDQENPDNVSRTVQASKDECDINKIVARALRTGIAMVNGKEPIFGDFSGGDDFLSLQNKIAKTNESFMSLPADVRERFANSPAAMLDFISKPENLEESCKMGLLPMQLWKDKVKADAEASAKVAAAKEAADAAAKAAAAPAK